MVSTYTYPTFEICNAVWWVAKLLLGLFPLLSWYHLLYLYLYLPVSSCNDSWHELHWVQYGHDEWSNITSHGLSIISLTWKSAGGCAGRNANIYNCYTNRYYFPVVIVPVLVLCLRLSTKVSKSMQGQQVHARSASPCCRWHSSSVNTIGYPAANT